MHNCYWASFEFTNGEIGTWTDFAITADEFVAALLASERGRYIKRFCEMHLDQREGKTVFPPETVSIEKYNRQLRRLRKPKTSGGIYLKFPHTEGDQISVAHIALGSWSQDEEGVVLLSPECLSFAEVVHWADARIVELEKVKQEARRLFTKA